MAASAKRAAAAEAFAAKESGRAVGLRAELVEYARRVDELERELKLQRASVPTVADAADSRRAPEAARPPPNPPAHAAADKPSAGDAPPLLTDAIDAVPSVEAIAQLEAEVEYKRQQVAAQIVELRDREQQLHSAMSEAAALRSELDESRGDVARLERTIIDKDRALEARDVRIAALHEELKQRLAGVEKRGVGDFSLPTVESSAPRRAVPKDAEHVPTPALICLTGDAPKRFALTEENRDGRARARLRLANHHALREPRARSPDRQRWGNTHRRSRQP
jgi:hypothetical protein